MHSRRANAKVGQAAQPRIVVRNCLRSTHTWLNVLIFSVRCTIRAYSQRITRVEEWSYGSRRLVLAHFQYESFSGSVEQWSSGDRLGGEPAKGETLRRVDGRGQPDRYPPLIRRPYQAVLAKNLDAAGCCKCCFTMNVTPGGRLAGS
jgi:hypothetical protein